MELPQMVGNIPIEYLQTISMEHFGYIPTFLDSILKICDTHNEQDCKNVNSDNKATNNYPSSILLDSCASNHFVNRIPKYLNTMKQGIVKGSVTEAAPTKIIGSGRFKIGSVNLEACISPGLDSNLKSAGKLIKEGYEIQL